MKNIQFKASIDSENGVFSIVKSASFSVFRVARKNASVITSKKSPYADTFSRYGVYILVEDDCKNPLKFYVGKAGKISSRFIPHVSKASADKLNLNWTDAIIFVSTSNTFPWGEDEIAWFEYSLLKGIIEAGRYVYTNKPDQTKEGVVDETECGHQLSDMKLLVSLLGYPKLFEPIDRVVEKEPNGANSTYSNCPYSVASLMGAVVLGLAEDGKLSKEDVNYLLSERATMDLKMRGNRYLKVSAGVPNEHKDVNGVCRFLSGRKITVSGKSYLLSTQLFPASFDPVVAWISKRGYNLDRAVAQCKKFGMNEK